MNIIKLDINEILIQIQVDKSNQERMIIRLIRLCTSKSNYNYYKYSIKATDSGKSKTEINPLINMGYEQMNKILNAKISHKTQLQFYKAVVNTFVERAEQKNQHIKQQIFVKHQSTAKTILLNKCIDILITNIKKLNIDEFFQLVKLFLYMYSDHTVKFQQQNKYKFRHDVMKHYDQLVVADRNGLHLVKHLEILQFLLKFNRKQPALNLVIKNLGARALKKQEDFTNFLSWFSETEQIIFYKPSLYKILDRLLKTQNKQMTKSQVWVKPNIFRIVVNCTQKNRTYSHLILSRFLEGLKKQLQDGNISRDDKLQYLDQMIGWLYLESPYLLHVKEYNQCYKIFYKIISDILKQQQNSNGYVVKVQVFKTMHNSMNKLLEIIKLHQILDKPYEQFRAQIFKLYLLIFENSFLNQIQNLTLENIADNLIADLFVPEHVQQVLIIKLLPYLNKFSEKDLNHNSCEHLLKILEFVVLYNVKTNKIPRQIIQSIIKAGDINYKSFTLEQVLQLYHCTRILGVKTQNLQQFSKYQQSLLYAQLISKSVLADVSDDIIDKLQKMKQKTQKRKMNKNQYEQQTNTKVLISIWNSLRISGNQTQTNSRNKIYTSFVYPNYQLIKSLINPQTYQTLYKTVIKQLHKQRKFLYNSLQFEFLIECHKFLMEKILSQNTNTAQYIENMSVQNFRLTFELEFVYRILLRCPRYSFKIKFAWHFFEMFNKVSTAPYFRYARLRTLCLAMLKDQKLNLYRQKPNLEVILFYRLMFNFNILNEQKQKNPVFITQLYLLAIYHNLPLFAKEKDQKTLQKEKKALNRLTNTCVEGVVYEFQFLIAYGIINHKYTNNELQKFLKDGFIPKSIYRGTLSSPDEIDIQTILNTLNQSLTLQFLFRRFPAILEPFFSKLISTKQVLFPHKLVQAANLQKKVKDLLSAETNKRFNNWIRQCLKQLKTSPAALELCLKFNIIPEQQKSMVDSYVRQSLKNCNFFILPILYINNYKGITKELMETAKIMQANQVLQFLSALPDYYGEFIELVNNILGVCLIQGPQQQNKQLLELIIKNILISKQFDYRTILKSVGTNNQQSVFQFYILLNVLLLRVKSYDSINQMAVQSFISQIQQIELSIQARIKALLQDKSIKTQTQVKREDEIILDNEQRPGVYRLISEYLTQYQKYKKVMILTAQQK